MSDFFQTNALFNGSSEEYDAPFNALFPKNEPPMFPGAEDDDSALLWLGAEPSLPQLYSFEYAQSASNHQSFQPSGHGNHQYANENQSFQSSGYMNYQSAGHNEGALPSGDGSDEYASEYENSQLSEYGNNQYAGQPAGQHEASQLSEHIQHSNHYERSLPSEPGNSLYAGGYESASSHHPGGIFTGRLPRLSVPVLQSDWNEHGNSSEASSNETERSKAYVPPKLHFKMRILSGEEQLAREANYVSPWGERPNDDARNDTDTNDHLDHHDDANTPTSPDLVDHTSRSVDQTNTAVGNTRALFTSGPLKGQPVPLHNSGIWQGLPMELIKNGSRLKKTPGPKPRPLDQLKVKERFVQTPKARKPRTTTKVSQDNVRKVQLPRYCYKWLEVERLWMINWLKQYRKTHNKNYPGVLKLNWDTWFGDFNAKFTGKKLEGQDQRRPVRTRNAFEMFVRRDVDCATLMCREVTRRDKYSLPESADPNIAPRRARRARRMGSDNIVADGMVENQSLGGKVHDGSQYNTGPQFNNGTAFSNSTPSNNGTCEMVPNDMITFETAPGQFGGTQFNDAQFTNGPPQLNNSAQSATYHTHFDNGPQFGFRHADHYQFNNYQMMADNTEGDMADEDDFDFDDFSQIGDGLLDDEEFPEEADDSELYGY